MLHMILLTDDNDGTALIACESAELAEEIGAAAIWSDGGVSAWQVPEVALVGSQDIVETLRGGGSCADLAQFVNPARAVLINANFA